MEENVTEHDHDGESCEECAPPAVITCSGSVTLSRMGAQSGG